MMASRGTQRGRMTPIGQIAYGCHREIKIHTPTEEETKEKMVMLVGLGIPGLRRYSDDTRTD